MKIKFNYLLQQKKYIEKLIAKKAATNDDLQFILDHYQDTAKNIKSKTYF